MRGVLQKKLNGYLANVGVIYIKLHNLHWNVVGTNFKAVHEYIETLYDGFALVLDETAEAPKIQGERPLASEADDYAIVPLMEGHLAKLENKKIFLFGTAGYNDTPEYFQAILDAAKEHISASNEIVGEYMCQGKVSAAKQEAIKKMDILKFETMKEDIEKSQSHPSEEDVVALLHKL